MEEVYVWDEAAQDYVLDVRQRRSSQTAGERAVVERDLRMGAHPIQGERENDAFLV